MPRPPNPTTPEAKALTAAIDARGLGAKARVADSLSVTPGLVSQYASGHRPVPWDRAEALAKAVGLSAGEISAEYRRIVEHFAASPSVRLTGSTILAAYREAVTKYELQGLHASSFDPLSDPDHAELLALAIIAQSSPAESDSRIQVKAEVGDGAKRKGAAGSRSVGEHRPQKNGGEGGASAGKRKKRAA